MEAKQFRKRNAILACLQGTTAHPGAETLYAMVKAENPDISLATVYRNLTRFKEQGLIVSLGTVNGVERFDGNISRHAHFICRRCGRVGDLAMPDLPVPGLNGVRIENCSLSYTGLCRNCLREGGEEA